MPGEKLPDNSSVLFVCTANICRSPMAAALFAKKIKAGLGWRVESAGTWAPEGQPAASRAQMVLRGRGLDLSQHRSRSVNREMLQEFDLILTMERGHKEALQAEFPEIAARVYMLSEMTGQVFNIEDPIGGPLSEYENTARELEDLLERGCERILQLVA